MAEFLLAFRNTLKWEDSPLHPGLVTREPHNGRARLGINSIAHPDLPDTFWTCDYQDALEQAEKIYRSDYWAPLQLDQLQEQDIADKIFDLGVNAGTHTAARLAQEAANVEVDGIVGPVTLAAINQANPGEFLDTLRSLATMHYENLIASNPQEYEPWKRDWLERAKS